MELPIDDLLYDERSDQWVMACFHPNGLTRPGCGRGTDAARRIRRTRQSRVTVSRCHQCHRVYNVSTGTIVQGKHFCPTQVMVRGATENRRQCSPGT